MGPRTDFSWRPLRRCHLFVAQTGARPATDYADDEAGAKEMRHDEIKDGKGGSAAFKHRKDTQQNVEAYQASKLLMTLESPGSDPHP